MLCIVANWVYRTPKVCNGNSLVLWEHLLGDERDVVVGQVNLPDTVTVLE